MPHYAPRAFHRHFNCHIRYSYPGRAEITALSKVKHKSENSLFFRKLHRQLFRSNKTYNKSREPNLGVPTEGKCAILRLGAPRLMDSFVPQQQPDGAPRNSAQQPGKGTNEKSST